MKKESAIKRGKKKKKKELVMICFLDFGLGVSISPSIFYAVCSQ